MTLAFRRSALDLPPNVYEIKSPLLTTRSLCTSKSSQRASLKLDSSRTGTGVGLPYVETGIKESKEQQQESGGGDARSW